MRALLAAPAAAFVGLLGSLSAVPSALADPAGGAANPLLRPRRLSTTPNGRSGGGLTSLRVYPTPSGRAAPASRGRRPAADEAWAEVLALSPDADTAGMRAQFICHWQFAELAQPGKASWNLEPWRPVVDDAEMVASGCNPGGPEEPF